MKATLTPQQHATMPTAFNTISALQQDSAAQGAPRVSPLRISSTSPLTTLSASKTPFVIKPIQGAAGPSQM